MRRMFKNKRGNLEDWAFSIAIMFMVIMSVFFTNLVLYKFNEKIQGLDSVDDVSKQILQDDTTQGINFLDNMIIVFYALLVLVVLTSAYFIQSNTKFAIIGILFVIFTVWFIPLMSEIGIGILTANNTTTVIANLMPRSYWILQNMTMLQIVFWLLVVIALYAKNQIQQGEQTI